MPQQTDDMALHSLSIEWRTLKYLCPYLHGGHMDHDRAERRKHQQKRIEVRIEITASLGCCHSLGNDLYFFEWQATNNPGAQ